MAAAVPEWRLARVMEGYVTTQLLYVAAKLGIPEVLAAGSRTGAQVAEAVGADPAAVTRVLRGLAVEEVVDELEDERFALTGLGQALASLEGPIIVRGELYYRAAAGLLDAVREGGTAFERVYGERFFDHLEHHPDHEAAFQASMAGRAEREAGDVVAAYDFTAVRRLVDVGGGRGVLLSAILRAAPDLHGVLLDRPAAIPEARRRLDADGLGDRAECIAGDFFAGVPAGADAYLLSRVIHDWEDDDAVRILATCRAAMTERARLLLVEAILPERARERPDAIRMDLHMLILLGARERTEAEFRRLLADAGLEPTRVLPTASPAGLAVIEATRA
ncbi:MAG TPA: methyltransferase [Solirubrobacteraceae bacterium]|nr:methyltransferase [Solirubrobacteraceae bacterium]